MSHKKFRCRELALIRSRKENKLLQESLWKQSKKIEELEKEKEKLKRENEKLKEELKALRKPPEWVRLNKSDEAKKRAKKKGPKKGHQPNIRKVPQKIDQEINIVASHCEACHHELPRPHKWHSHIQIDLPPKADVITTRYHVGWSYCKNCKKEVSAKERLSYSQYGPRLHAYVCYLKFSLGLTLGKISKTLWDQYGISISTGELSELLTRSTKKFEGAYKDLATSLLDQKYIHADETGWRKDGDNYWLWSFSNKDISYYAIDKSRSNKIIEKTLGKTYGGILLSDFYAGYDRIDCKKQKCWVHILRELKKLKERYPKNTEIRHYARRIKAYYKRGIKLQGAYHLGEDIERALKYLKGSIENFLFVKPRHHKLKTLSTRLKKYRNELYVFIKENIDATNNAAEREIRPTVLMRKTSYCNRSDQGVKNQSVLMSMIRTSEKRNQNFVTMATDYLKC